MKYTYYIILFSIISFVSCTKEISENNEVTLTKVSTKLKESNTTYIENSEHVVTYRIKDGVDKTPKLFTLYPVFKQKIELDTWQEVDAYLKSEFNKLEDKAVYSFDIQMLSYEILVKKLLNTEKDNLSDKAIYNYLNLLVEQEAVDLDILTNALKRTQGSIVKPNYTALRNYILDVAKNDLATIPTLLKEAEQELNSIADKDRNLEKHIIFYKKLINEANYAMDALALE